MPDVINLSEKLGRFHDHWSPKIIADLNDSHVKLVKVKGEFVWHHHDNEDELFLILDGQLRIEFRDRTLELGPGEMVSHSPGCGSSAGGPGRGPSHADRAQGHTPYWRGSRRPHGDRLGAHLGCCPGADDACFSPSWVIHSPDYQKDTMRPAGIAQYHSVDFRTVKGASQAAEKLITYVTGKGVRHNTGPKRAVIYGERADGAASVQALLYLSPGALEAARELKMLFTQMEEFTADKLPESAILLHGQP